MRGGYSMYLGLLYRVSWITHFEAINNLRSEAVVDEAVIDQWGCSFTERD